MFLIMACSENYKYGSVPQHKTSVAHLVTSQLVIFVELKKNTLTYDITDIILPSIKFNSATFSTYLQRCAVWRSIPKVAFLLCFIGCLTVRRPKSASPACTFPFFMDYKTYKYVCKFTMVSAVVIYKNYSFSKNNNKKIHFVSCRGSLCNLDSFYEHYKIVPYFL